MAARVSDWLSALDELFPPFWAEGWDNVGLQVGDRAWPADRILVALDPTPDVVTEARDRECGLLVTHHPLIFRPLERLIADDGVARTALQAAAAEIAVTACHTNADIARPGVSDALAQALGVEVTDVLQSTGSGSRVKLVTFVPPDATDKVLDAVALTGAGVIGEYSHCSFRVRGTGTFLPSEAAQPVTGQRGTLNEAEEDRLEIVVPREVAAEAIRALLDTHPYEEVAYDVYPLEGPTGLGFGRVGRLPESMPVAEFAARCREILGGDVRVAGDSDRNLSTVAVCGGSGASFVEAALRAGVDAYVTGDLKHHQALDAADAGLVVVDAGHFATEWPFVPWLADRLREARLGDVEVSELRTDPWGN